MARKAARPNNERPATISDHNAGCGKAGIAESLDQETTDFADLASRGLPLAAWQVSRLGEGTRRQAEPAGLDNGAAHA
ncbi:hypothetical protein GGE07_001300 [Sinorhizobium terangae]|uniref:Uncharacterized protein n=1 Tax=Sinorhizobium terangae TaxID=110322 RepID=A0A6N7LIZ3_SINTE|nr:hypothetical protein [Sinorhizobium terangae]MBB4184674.1 hypothetical protein [Sinorhizobium terangae]MQX16815.1 hypothetical protein [Sinorhizobium terangae]